MPAPLKPTRSTLAASIRQPAPALPSHAPITLQSIDDLERHEVDIVATINATPKGALLFLADPFRFLREHGFPVEPALADDLRRRAPVLQQRRATAYDDVLSGKAPVAHVHVRITSLGINAMRAQR